jgi:hypothetical protein
VGPITLSANDPTIAAESSGINPTYSSATNSPTYSSGGSITGSTGQTCNLSNFGVGGTSGIDPTYSPATNSPTYTSGGTISGTAGQTCSLSNFNGVNGATATVLLTGTNTIASGTHLIITSEGSGATSPPTTATLGNGTATCSGTANVITALISVAGNGFGVIGAAANVALTGKNTIAAGTHLTVTASGFGGTTPPTTATLSNGSAMCSGTANVITSLTGSGVFTAQNPGSTSIFASVSGVNGVSTPYVTCPVVNIFVHDASSPNTSFSLGTGGTQPLTADVYDSMGQYIKPNLTWGSSSTATAKVVAGTTGNNPATVTAVASGTASITASCSSPDCNRNLSAQYSTNVVTVGVTGSSTTTVYAASTTSNMLVPITTSTNSAGTALTLPNLPNSMVFDPAGNTLYLGSSAGLMAVNLTTNVITTSTVPGKVVAISPDSNYLLLSDATTNAIYYVSPNSSSVTYIVGATTTNSSAFTPDSKYNEWVSGMDLSFGFQNFLIGMTNLSYTANAMAISAQGGLTYVTGSNPNQIDVRSTCNQAEVPPTLSANNPTLIQPIPNGTGAVATDSPSIDVISTQSPVTTNCPITTQSTVSSFDLGAGPFNAAQLFLSADSSRAWIISDLTELLEFNLQSSTPSMIPYAGNAVAYSGGITLDGAQVYVGTSDGTVHRIDVASSSDAQQIGVGLKDANGNLVAPNLVGVRP